MIELKQVVKKYGTQTALNEVSLSVTQGECIALLGPSGCGKSTLLKIINLMEPLTSGDIFINNQSIQTYQPEILRRQIGYCIQNVGLFPHYTIYENIAIVPNLLKWPIEKIDQRVQFLLELSHLPKHYLNKKPNELSGGEAQRVGVCRALAADPPILLMDEPFGAVDPLTREKLQQAFIQLQQALKKTVLFVTHDVEEAVIIGDRVAIMEKGRLLTCRPPQALGQLTLETNEHAFVTEFLSSEYTLSLLKRYNILTFLRQSQIPEKPIDSLASIKEIHETATLKDVLSLLIKEGTRGLNLKVAEKTYSINYNHLIQFMEEVTQT